MDCQELAGRDTIGLTVPGQSPIGASIKELLAEGAISHSPPLAGGML
jgi:hypothetical protein